MKHKVSEPLFSFLKKKGGDDGRNEVHGQVCTDKAAEYP